MTWSTTVEIHNLTEGALTIKENNTVLAQIAPTETWSMAPTSSAHELQLDFQLAADQTMSGKLKFSPGGFIFMDRGNLPDPDVQFITLGGIVEGSEMTQTANDRSAEISSPEWAAAGGTIRMTFTKNIEP